MATESASPVLDSSCSFGIMTFSLIPSSLKSTGVESFLLLAS